MESLASKNLLTIVIPTYNSQHYIKRLLDKLRGQIQDNIQVCIIDDGSTDDTCKILYSLNLNCSFEIYSILHGGVSHARNYGIKKATGKYICFIDSDDDIESNFISIFLKYYKNNYDIIMMDANKTVVPRDRLYDSDQYKYLFTGFQNNKYFITPGIHSKFYKTSLIKNNQINFCEDLKIGEDIIFNISSILKSSNVLLTKNHVYNYLDPHTMNKFRTDRVENELLFQKILKSLLSNYKYKVDVISYYKIHGIIALVKDYFSYSPLQHFLLPTIFQARCLKKIVKKEYCQYLKSIRQNVGLGKEEIILKFCLKHGMYWLSLVLAKSARLLKSKLMKI